MTIKQFKFHASSGAEKATEVNIFVHGFNASYNDVLREKLVSSIPETLNHQANIEAEM